MKPETEVKIGLIGCVIFIIYGIIPMILIFLFNIKTVNWLPHHPALPYAVVIAPIFAFALKRKHLKLAKVMYYIWVGIVIFWSVIITFVGWFTLTSPPSIPHETTVIILVVLAFTGILIIPFKIGIRGLEKIVESS